MTSVDPAAADELLTTTRAVRRRLDLDRPVDLRLVTESIRAAIQAPTGGNKQLWRWIVVTDPDLRSTLADLYREGENGMFGRRIEEYRQTDSATSRVYQSADYLAGVLHRVPVHVIPCTLGRLTELDSLRASNFYGSILPAVWSFQLALRARGLGSVFTTLHLAREAEAARLLGIPEDVTQVALIPIAHADPRAFKPAAGRAVEDVIAVDGWSSGWEAS